MSVLIITVIAAFISNFADNKYVKYAFEGIRVAVCSLVSVTVFGLFKKNVKDILTAFLSIAAFVFTYFFGISPIVAVIFAAVVGITVKVIKEKRENKKEVEDK